MNAELKKCSTCGSSKLVEYFTMNVKGIYKKTCNHCLELSTLKRERNREKNTEYAKQYYVKVKQNRVKRIVLSAEERKANSRLAEERYRAANVEKCRERRRAYLKDKKGNCLHDTRKTRCNICNPNGYLKHIVSSRVRKALKDEKSKKTLEYLGCDMETYRPYLEGTFKEGMTWENQGEWEIDHIIPVAYKQDGVEPSIEEVGRRLYYTNTQAMWAVENRAKGNHHIG
jgi:hypothetical protein